MKLAYILVMALAALALGLASVSAAAPALAGGRGGMSGDIGNISLLAGGAYGGVLGPSSSLADVGAPALAGSKPGASICA